MQRSFHPKIIINPPSVRLKFKREKRSVLSKSKSRDRVQTEDQNEQFNFNIHQFVRAQFFALPYRFPKFLPLPLCHPPSTSSNNFPPNSLVLSTSSPRYKSKKSAAKRGQTNAQIRRNNKVLQRARRRSSAPSRLREIRHSVHLRFIGSFVFSVILSSSSWESLGFNCT